ALLLLREELALSQHASFLAGVEVCWLAPDAFMGLPGPGFGGSESAQFQRSKRTGSPFVEHRIPISEEQFIEAGFIIQPHLSGMNDIQVQVVGSRVGLT